MNPVMVRAFQSSSGMSPAILFAPRASQVIPEPDPMWARYSNPNGIDTRADCESWALAFLLDGIGTSPDREKATRMADGIGTSPDRERALRLVGGIYTSPDYEKEISMADDGIGTSPDREKAQRPSQQDGIGTSPDREKRKSPSRPEGIGTSP